MHPTIPIPFEVGAGVVLIGILIADLLIARRRPHLPTPRESALWVSVYVALALLFALTLWIVNGPHTATQFVAGWLTEYSLSVDNLFVFLLLMTRFAVPAHLQQQTLMVGILLALIFRAIFIVLGAALIEQFGWIFYFFGAFLIYTAVKQVFDSDNDEPADNAVTRALKRRLPLTDSFAGSRLSVRINGRRRFTPLLIVIIALGTTDVLFALDSIPAIFGITTDGFLVLSANLFALMGLRQLYFLLGRLLDTLTYLKYGIAVVLGFIGIKLVLHALHNNELPFINKGNGLPWAPEIPTALSLAVIVLAIGGATVVTLLTRDSEPATS